MKAVPAAASLWSMPARLARAWAARWPIAAGLMLALLVGCEKEKPTPVHPSTEPAGASVTHFEDDGPMQVSTNFAATQPAPRPTGPLPAGSSCITAECHASFVTARHVHGPISEKACDACHGEDVGGHVYPLKRGSVETCTFCHSVTNTQAHQHAAIQKEGCTACHRPHASDTKYLLTQESVERVCAQCHDVPLKKHAHEPFANGQCTLCHQPHQSNYAKLLRGGEGPEHCFSCHAEVRNTLLAGSNLHEPAGKSCTTCHNPHAADAPHQLNKPTHEVCFQCHEQTERQIQRLPIKHGALGQEESCAACHQPHASSQPRLLKDRMDRVCLDCHDKALKASDGHVVADMRPALSAANLHGPIRNGDCTSCHGAHAGEYPNLLHEAFPKSFYAPFNEKDYALCFRCHDRELVMKRSAAGLTNFRDGDVNLHYLHVHRDPKGRTCKTCHSIHGSNLPNHIASEVPFEGSGWSMPIGYQKSDSGGSCSPGCHQQVTYDRTRRRTVEPESTTEPATEPTTRGVP